MNKSDNTGRQSIMTAFSITSYSRQFDAVDHIIEVSCPQLPEKSSHPKDLAWSKLQSVERLVNDSFGIPQNKYRLI